MKNYPFYRVNYYTRFRDMIDGVAENKENESAVGWFSRKGVEEGVTFGELRSHVLSLRRSFIEMGLAGKHIAIVGENSYEWLLVYLASACCGAVAVCVDIEQSDETICQMIRMADADAIFRTRNFDMICDSFASESVRMFLLNGSEEGVSNVRDLISAGEALPECDEYKRIDDAVTPDTTAAIVFTSGTTNYSKPVMLSHSAILTNASDALANVKIGNVSFTSLPFYHTYGMTCSVLAILIIGAKLYINGNLKTVLRDIHLAEPDTMLTVPLMLETFHNRIWISAEESGKAESLRKLFAIRKVLYKLGFRKSGKTLEAIRKKCFSNIRIVICGAAHMNEEIMTEFTLMGMTVLQGYGITECAPLVSVNRNKANKFGSVGLVTQNCEVKLVDDEILVRGKNLMQGYYKMPELTEEVMRDGWFCTGDLGRMDRDGFIYITGRKKNLIVFKNGKKLSPEKLEEKLRELDLVKDVVVYGAASGVSTDDVQVAVSIFPDKERAEGMGSYEILERLQREINELNRGLPMYQQIQMVKIRENEFSKTALQKIKRHMI